jgi:spermidine dehydrogenase
MNRSEYRELGMDRKIARRDFLNGVAVGIGVLGTALPAAAQATPQTEAANYPPLRSGLRGNYPAAVDIFNPIRQGQYAKFPVADSEISEDYDLVIVGGGISGLSAAYFYQLAMGKQSKILILDNHDDFGGHAKRNEFHYKGKKFIGYGGTQGIATPFPYSYAAKSLVRELGIEVERNPEFLNHDLEQKFGMGAGTFFNKENFLEDKLVKGNPRSPAFFKEVPVSDSVRADLIRVHGKNPDYMPGMSAAEKQAKLERISYQDFLLNYAKISRDAIPFFMGAGGRNNKRVDTTPAWEAAEHGLVGFNGLGIHAEEKFLESSYLFHFPDGNASVARLLVGKIIPGALPPKQSMNTIVQADLDYSKLDVAGAPMRIRLGSPVVRAENTADSVKIAYMQGGKAKAVRAQYCVMACYNAILPALMPEMPQKQKDALAYAAKVPMMYNNALLTNFKAFQKLGVARISAPCMYHPNTSLDPGSTVGGYSGVSTPDEPIIVRFVRSPNKPGLPRREQNRLGSKELLDTSFEGFELEIRRQLARMLGAGGFDPARDIAAITVNRWPYGYAYTYDTLADPDVAPEQRPHVIGRQRLGRVTIANSDAGAAAFTNQAIDEAHRAIQELLVLQGLT